MGSPDFKAVNIVTPQTAPGAINLPNRMPTEVQVPKHFSVMDLEIFISSLYFLGLLMGLGFFLSPRKKCWHKFVSIFQEKQFYFTWIAEEFPSGPSVC